MARGRDDLDSEAFRVEDGGDGSENFDFTAIAATTVHTVDIAGALDVLQ
jgi:hypothetical protein